MTVIVAILAAALLATAPQPNPQNDGFGVCPAFTHLHELKTDPDGAISKFPLFTPVFHWSEEDGLCHRDDNDDPVKERPKLPKPSFYPNPKDKWL